jgi:hypothetical protein
MATTYLNLGQAATLATTETLLYTVPASTSAIIATVVVCNRGNSSTTFRVSVSVGGGATATKDYLYYDVSIAANDTFVATVGLTLATTDRIRVYAGNANLSFSAWGTQIT